MLIYKLTFENERICAVPELYHRGGTPLSGGGLFVADGECASFDTYFNSFSHSRYKQYTTVKNVTLELDLTGQAEVNVFRYVDGAHDELIAKKLFTASDELTVNVLQIADGGFLYFTLTAKGDCKINGGGWHTDAIKKRVNVGIVICTFKREEYLKRNLKNLSDYAKTLSHPFFDVYVVDNARTIGDDFADGFTLIPNKNTGGSGGFARGMREVCESGKYTHVLLMDDDVLFDANVLGRTESMLALLKDEYASASIGGAMLVLENPHIQWELGADWSNGKIQSLRKRLDAREASTICGNEEEREPDYNAWFYMCMPSDTPKKYGYPLPFFIRCDDIEYGLRATEHIIMTSGIAVWHGNFDDKYSPQLEYYVQRNELILGSIIERGKGLFKVWRRLCRGIGKTVATQRYYAADLRFRAYDDFLKGPEFFLNVDPEANHLSLKKHFPRFLTDDELKAEYGIDSPAAFPHKGKNYTLKHLLTLGGYLIPKCFFKRKIACVDMCSAKIGDFFLHKKVLHYNPVYKVGFITEIKKAAVFKYGFKLLAYFFKLLFRFRKTAMRYAAIDLKSV